MSQYLLYLNLEPYLAQWFVHEMGGSPVRLPKGCAEADIIEMFLIPTPSDALPDLPGNDKVPIYIPTFKYKDVRYYNYLSPRARLALVRCISNSFKVQLWQDIHTLHNTDYRITDIIYAWMEMHGIECNEKNWETIRQMYFRKRKIYLRNKNKENNSDITDEN